MKIPFNSAKEFCSKWHYFDQVYSRFTRDAKWPSSRHRQGRYGGKLRNDGSRKQRPEMRLLFAGYSTDGIFEKVERSCNQTDSKMIDLEQNLFY